MGSSVWVCGKELLVFFQVSHCIFTRLGMDDMFHNMINMFFTCTYNCSMFRVVITSPICSLEGFGD